MKPGKTETALLALIRSSLFGKEESFDDDVDFDAVLEEATAQTVVALVEKSVPKDKAEKWQLPAYQSKAIFLRVLYEQTNAVSLLTAAKIPFVIIKGAAAAVYYPVPSGRTMGDVDIYVGEENFDKAFKVFESNGYVLAADHEDDGRDYSFSKGGVILELHRRYSDEGHDIENYLLSGVARAESMTVCDNVFPALPKAENGLVLLDHIRHHIYGGLGLRQIIDFMEFINSDTDENFEREYLPLFEKVGLLTLAEVIGKVCKKYLGLPKTAAWCESADDKTCDELLENVFLSGNFGRKTPYEYRPMQSFTMDVKKYGLLRSLQRAGVANCKAFQKHKFLRPLAWLYQSLRYLVRGTAALLKGKARRKDIAEGKKKADFYKRLGI